MRLRGAILCGLSLVHAADASHSPSASPMRASHSSWDEGRGMGDWDYAAAHQSSYEQPAEYMPPPQGQEMPDPDDSSWTSPEVDDVVAAMRRSWGGRLKVSCSGSLCGAALLTASTASMIGSLASVTIGLLLGALLTFEGGRAGELQRALAVSLILTLQRWSTLKAQYDVLGQLVAMVPGRSRRVFPPKVPGNSVQFSVARTILAAGLLGSAGGWALANAIHFFLLPSWLLALVAAVGTAYASRRDDRQGDLIRCTSMKCVGAAELIFKSACETRVPSKAASVAGQLGVFVAAVDKKYEVRRKVGDVLNWGISRFSSGDTEEEVEDDRGDESDGPPSNVRRAGDRRRARRNPDVDYDYDYDYGAEPRSTRRPPAPQQHEYYQPPQHQQYQPHPNSQFGTQY